MHITQSLEGYSTFILTKMHIRDSSGDRFVHFLSLGAKVYMSYSLGDKIQFFLIFIFLITLK